MFLEVISKWPLQRQLSCTTPIQSLFRVDIRASHLLQNVKPRYYGVQTNSYHLFQAKRNAQEDRELEADECLAGNSK